MKSVLLIGLGNFGMMIAKQIHELGHQVMAVDIDEERVNEALPYATNALIGDSTNANFLASLGVNNFDVLIRNKIALWDVIQSCDIVGSSDSSITNVVPNDLSVILNTADIKAIYVNGKTALPMRFKFLRKTHIRIFPMKNLKTQVSCALQFLRRDWQAR